jgi:cation diffusion facilitator family transporter
VGLIAVRFSQKKSDEKHPYGYEKYETIGTFVVVMLIFFLAYETFSLGITNLFSETPQPDINPIVFLSIIVTIIINILTTLYESNKGKKLKSEFLIADATETRSDIIVSIGVMLGLILMMYTNLPLDGILPILIAILIVKNAWGIFKEVSDILTDRNVIDVDKIKEVVLSHPKVKFCHAIRSRGKSDAIFLDFHLGVEDDLSVKEAHDTISHEVKLLLKDKIGGIKSAFIHIEPQSAEQRKRSVFVETDDYGYDDLL